MHGAGAGAVRIKQSCRIASVYDADHIIGGGTRSTREHRSAQFNFHQLKVERIQDARAPAEGNQRAQLRTAAHKIERTFPPRMSAIEAALSRHHGAMINAIAVSRTALRPQSRVRARMP